MTGPGAGPRLGEVYATLIVLAALWGAATGVLLPRPAYRLSVEPEDAWRDRCPAGHPITGPARGWLGRARCPGCATSDAVATGATGATGVGVGAGFGSDAGPGAGAGADSNAAVGDYGAVAVPEATGATGVTGATGAPGATEAAEAPGAADGPGPGTASAGTTPVSDHFDHSGHSGAPDASLVRYAPSLLVPVLGALGCAALAAATGPRPELAVWLLLAPFALLLAVVDRNVHRLPDQLTLPLALAAAVLLGLATLVPGGPGGGGGADAGRSWTTALLGGVVLGACYFVLFLINPNGMGFGDVKLALSLGVVLGWYGWPVLGVGAFAGFLLGALYGVGLMVLRRAGRKSVIPFGPFMIVGALLGLLLGALSAA
ncbi:prepilin peptidase [Streptomyces sp. NPDC059255]|uniref:prepilin peptidase n=1 Tax=Streptomyces sp. NPDC059255 TaxID=3346793 RepID=UPI00367FFBBC